MKINEVTQVNEIVGGMLGTLAQSFMKQMGDYQSASLMDPMSSGSGGQVKEITAKMAPSIYELWKHSRHEIMAAGTQADWEDVPAATKQAKLEQILDSLLTKFNPQLKTMDQLKTVKIDPQLKTSRDQLLAKIDALKASVLKQGMNTPDQTALAVWQPLVQSLYQAATMGQTTPAAPTNKTKSRVTTDPATGELMVDGQPFDKTNVQQVQLVKQFIQNANRAAR